MKRALLSDIHANQVALEACLADCRKRGVDDVVCLGDIVGYGPDPVECVDQVRKSCAWVLAGNHDAALFMSVPVGFNKYARDAIEWQRSKLMPGWISMPQTTERWNWLKTLQPSRQEGAILYVHATPRDPLLEYIDEGDFAEGGFGQSFKAQSIFENIQLLAFCGHTHRPGVVMQNYRWVKPEEFPEQTCRLDYRIKTLINVGSVGQPRDGNPAACYAIFDDQAATIQFVRVPYDIAEAQRRFKKAGKLDERLWSRLESGT